MPLGYDEQMLQDKTILVDPDVPEPTWSISDPLGKVGDFLFGDYQSKGFGTYGGQGSPHAGFNIGDLPTPGPKTVLGSNQDPYRDDSMENRMSFSPPMVSALGVERQKSDELVEAAAEDWASRFKRDGNLDFYEQQKANRKKFLGQSNMIFFQTLALDALAQHTGTKSYAEAFARSAMADLDARQKSAEEDTLAAAMEALYFRPDGTYDPPKTQQEAFEALTRMGVDPVSASGITGNVIEQKDKKYGWVDSKGQLRVTKQPPKDHEYTELTDSQAAEFISGNRVTPTKMTAKQQEAAYFAKITSALDALPADHPERKHLETIRDYMQQNDNTWSKSSIMTKERYVKEIFDKSFSVGDVFDSNEFARAMGMEEGTEIRYDEALRYFNEMLSRKYGLPTVYDASRAETDMPIFATKAEAEAARANGTLTASSGPWVGINGMKHPNPEYYE